jgi:hypothetical protein
LIRHVSTREQELKGMSGHKAIYRLLLPPMLGCLAVGSITFYGLELWWTRLDSQLALQEAQAEVDGLHAKLRARMEGSEAAPSTPTAKAWWKVW